MMQRWYPTGIKDDNISTALRRAFDAIYSLRDKPVFDNKGNPLPMENQNATGTSPLPLTVSNSPIPASSTSPGTPGAMVYDASGNLYLHVGKAWKRVALSDF